MSMFISENDVLIVFRSAITRVASCLNIENIDLKATYELYEEIRNSDSPLIYPLQNFLNSYNEWFYFHFNRKEKDELDQKEKEELKRLIQDRDNKRQEFINELENSGC